MKLRAILIDDEHHCVEILRWELSRHCPQIEVIDTAASAQEGYDLILRTQPDVVFLDIEMPVMNGFDLLERFDTVPFEVIFTTAYDQFAIHAIRVSALDYLLKPINRIELKEAVSKLEQRKKNDPDHLMRMAILKNQLREKGEFLKKIALPCADGLEILDMEEILYCKADSNYTEIHLASKKRFVVAKTLKQIEEMLEHGNFLRVHQSYLVNLDRVIKYVRGGGGYLILDDHSTVNVAQSKKDLLLEKLQRF